jgi:hypothetical protein
MIKRSVLFALALLTGSILILTGGSLAASYALNHPKPKIVEGQQVKLETIPSYAEMYEPKEKPTTAPVQQSWKKQSRAKAKTPKPSESVNVSSVENEIAAYKEADKSTKLNILRTRKDHKETKGAPIAVQAALSNELTKRLQAQKAAKKLDISKFEEDRIAQASLKEVTLTPFQKEWKEKLKQRESNKASEFNK